MVDKDITSALQMADEMERTLERSLGRYCIYRTKCSYALHSCLDKTILPRLEELPALLLPRKGRYGLVDYEKTFTNDAATDIFDERGIDRKRGALIVVRPDQFVAHVLPPDAYAELSAFLRPIFRVG